MLRFRALFAVLAILGTFAFIAAEADARGGRGGSMGSRGSRTYTAPPATATTPNAARPVERSMAQPGAATSAAGRSAAAQPGGLFNRPGMMGGLIAGFLGAGLLGLLFGNGLLGGLGGLASMIGLLVQVGLVVIVGRLLWNWWQRRQQPAQAYAGGPSPRESMTPPRDNSLLNSARSGLGPMGTSAASQAVVEVKPEDFDAFERLLDEVQTAYGKEDLAGLRARLTPEMLSYFSEELSENASRGVVNRVSGVKLLQGDLAEAWREGGVEYASVAMRYELTDSYVDRTSGRVVEGDAERPQEVTEVWTFMRARDGNWLLSAIQQT